MEATKRNSLKDKKRIVIKIGSSSLTHPETGELNLTKIEKLIRVLSDLRGEGKEVVLVSSGAIAAGRQAFGHHKRPDSLAEKQAFAAVGQARLMMVYQKLCSEYNQTAAQVLLTKDTMVNDSSRYNAQNTFDELLRLGAIPVVNENDTVSTSEIPYVDSFGDNDRLSAIVAALIGADLLILLSDIDGLYTDDPRSNPDAKFISLVPEISQKYLNMGKETSGSSVGTGGMSAKLAAARIATVLTNRKSTKPARSAVLPSRTMHCSATSAVHSCNKTVQQQGGAPHRAPSCFCERKMQAKCGKFAHFVLQNCMRCDTIYSIFYKAGERCAGLAAKGTLYGRAAAGNSAYPAGPGERLSVG